MTSRQDTWTTIATPPWVQALTLLGSPFATTNGLLYSVGVGNRLFYAMDTVTNSGITVANPAEVTLTATHGYTAAETFTVYIEGATGVGGVLANGHWTATATGTFTFTIPIDTAGGVTLFGTTLFNKKTTALTGSQQDVQALVLATAEGATNDIAIWAKLDVRGGPTAALRAGYGARLTWGTGGTRTLSLLKIHPDTGAYIVLASTTAVTMFEDSAGSDLGGLQRLRLIVTDQPKVGGEPEAVRLRAYVNTDDLTGPTAEFLDRGHQGTPPHTGNGTWGIEITPATVVMSASFEATDTFHEVTPGIGPIAKRRTRAVLRDELKMELARGPVDNFDDDLCNLRLERAIDEIDDFFGDRAVWRDRTQLLSFAQDTATQLTVVPYEIERIHYIWRKTDQQAIGWKLVGLDGEDRLLITLDDEGTENPYIVHYRLRRTAMVADTDVCSVPRQWDEMVVLAAAARMVDGRRDPEYAGVLNMRLERRKVQVMSFINRNYGRMERQQINIQHEAGGPIVGIGAPWQQWGPY